MRPNTVATKFKIEVDDIAAMSYQDEQDIKNAILNALKAGKTRARVAQNIRAVQYVTPVVNASDLIIVSLQVSIDNGTTWLDQAQLGVDQFPVTTSFDISVVQA